MDYGNKQFIYCIGLNDFPIFFLFLFHSIQSMPSFDSVGLHILALSIWEDAVCFPMFFISVLFRNSFCSQMKTFDLGGKR